MPPGISSTIPEICAAAKEARISFDDGKGPITSEDTSYDFNCESIFNQAIEFQKKNYGGAYKMWNPSQIRSIKELADKHGFGLKILLPQHPSGGGKNILSIDPHGQFLNLGLTATVPQAPEAVPMMFRHEMGHLSDLGIVILLQPGYHFWLNKGAPNASEGLKIMNAFITAAKSSFSPEEQNRFADLGNRFLQEAGALSLSSLQELYQALLEAFRFGEESHDPVVVDYLLREDHRFYWKHNLRETNRFAQALHIACLQEAGVWKEFQAKAGFDLSWTASVSSTAIDFFRTMIHASALLFYAPLR